ncbi:MAG TPA: tetratricopeptide repeat protein [Methylomirabilota bacterium]|nr:tetratricopeptide repeat protein [Methylomirabilota bacterium]
MRTRMHAGVPGILGALLALGLVVGAGRTAGGAVSEADRLWVVGVQAFEDGLYDLTYRELGRFVEMVPAADPRRGDAIFLRGKAAFALGRYTEALRDFQGAQTVPLQVIAAGEPLFWEAEALFRLRRFEDARDRYSLFLRNHPGAPYAADALYARAFSELELGHPDEALASFNQLLTEFPKSELAASAAYAAARELVRAKRWEDALPLLSTYQNRYVLSRFLPEVRYLLGVTQLETGRTPEGVRTLEQFLAANPSQELAPSARIVLGETHAKAGRGREAIEQYRALVKQAPTHPFVPQALYQIGELSQRLGRAADAESAWKTLRRDHPGDALAALAGLELAQGYLKRRQFDQAMDVAREVADSGGAQRFQALLLLGESALKAGKLGDAETAYARALAEAPPDSPERLRALAGVGLVAESQREAGAARRAYQEIIDKAEDAELVQWAKGRVQGLEAREKPPPRPAPKGKPRSKLEGKS